MRLFKIRGAALALAVAALFVSSQAHAISYTLQELTDGTTPSITVGGLTFSNFGANVLGDLGSDLSVFTVEVVGTDLQINGPLAVGAGQLGQLTLQYDVVSTVPFLSASATLAGAVTGGYAALGEEWFSGGSGGGALLAVTRLQLDPGETNETFSTPIASLSALRIQKEITLLDGASVTGPVVQGFVVPEPSIALMMGLGLAGLAIQGRRRS